MQRRTVGLDDCVGDFGTGEYRKGRNHPVGVFFPDLVQKENAESGAGTAAERYMSVRCSIGKNLLLVVLATWSLV